MDELNKYRANTNRRYDDKADRPRVYVSGRKVRLIDAGVIVNFVVLVLSGIILFFSTGE